MIQIHVSHCSCCGAKACKRCAGCHSLVCDAGANFCPLPRRDEKYSERRHRQVVRGVQRRMRGKVRVA